MRKETEPEGDKDENSTRPHSSLPHLQVCLSLSHTLWLFFILSLILKFSIPRETAHPLSMKRFSMAALVVWDLRVELAN